MIVLPLTPDPEPTRAPMPKKAHEQTIIKLLVAGFSPSELKLLEGVVTLSKRRSPSIELLTGSVIDDAHVVVIDAVDKRAMAWASQQAGLKEKIVIWVDGQPTSQEGHSVMKRPVQWPLLPTLLMHAVNRTLEQRLTSMRAPLASRPMSVY